MKQTILRDWNFIRFLRLVLGLGVVIQAVVSKNWGVGLLGLYFTILPLFNIGCCGAGGCYTPLNQSAKPDTKIAGEKVNR